MFTGPENIFMYKKNSSHSVAVDVMVKLVSEPWSDCEMIRQPFPTYRQLHLIRPIQFYISIDEFIIIITVWSGGAKITGGRANIRGAGAQLRWAPPCFHHWIKLYLHYKKVVTCLFS